MFSVTNTKKIWFSISVVLFVVSVGVILTWGFQLGIDFTGGSLMEEHYTGASIDIPVIVSAVKTVTGEDPTVQPLGTAGAIIRTKFIDEKPHQEILKKIRAQLPKGGEIREERFETIGPTVSAELVSRAKWSIIAVMVAIVLYIAWAFRQVSQPLKSWVYGVVAVIALFHDVFIPAGIFAALGHFAHYEVDTLFVTALLTILGFSVHDTIVTFDRVREHLKQKAKEDFALLVDKSVRETLRRSVFTSLTVLLVLVPVYFLSVESIKHFTLTLMIGVVAGTYSSIFIACPLLVVWNNLAHKRA